MSREGPHILFCAFAEVPGPSANGVRTAQLIRAFGDGFDVDGLCLKGPEVAHIERLGSARIMRVPVENKRFDERLAAYRRALGRQLSGDHYDLVWCADLFSAAVAAAYKEAQGFSLVADVCDVPSESFARLYDVERGDKRLQAEWAAAEKTALRAATFVVAPSRTAARVLTGRVDARRVHLLARAVDRAIFAPPTVELALDETRTVLVVGGREGGALLAPGLDLLAALVERVSSDDVRIAFAGTPPEDDARVQAALEERGLAGKVLVVDVTSQSALAIALCDAHVVVVPSVAEVGKEPVAVPHRALESMSCRRPTVLTGPAAAFSDTLVPGEDALVVAAGAPREVAAAVEKLLAGPALREAVAQAGARRVEQEADLVTRLRQVAEFLSSVLGVTLAGGAEGTDPAEAFEPSQAGAAPKPPSTLPPPPVDDSTESGNVPQASRVAVRAAVRQATPERTAAAGSPLLLQPTERNEWDTSKSSSSVFTDEGGPQLPAPASPPAPSEVDLSASSEEGSLEEAPHLPVLPGDKTLIAPPPEGLHELLAGPDEDHAEQGGGHDEWYGDTRIDSGDRSPQEATPREARAASDIYGRVSSEPPTSSGPPGMRAFAAAPEPMSLPDGDPWGHDTIADARPVFTSDDTSKPRSTGTERTPPPAEKTRSGKSFLVDPELFDEGTISPLEDATLDEMQLPRDTPSSDG